MKEIAETNLFFKLIVHTVTNGISPYTYKLRAQILLEIFPTRANIGGCIYVNCETNVSYLAGILFKDIPSFQETSCLPRYKNLSVIQIEESKLAEANNEEAFNKLIKKCVSLEGKLPCCKKGCVGFEETSLSETGT